MTTKPIRVLTQSRTLSAAAASVFLYLVAVALIRWRHTLPVHRDLVFAIGHSVALLLFGTFAVNCDQRLERILYWLVAADFAGDLLIAYVLRSPLALLIERLFSIGVWMTCASVALWLVYSVGRKS